MMGTNNAISGYYKWGKVAHFLIVKADPGSTKGTKAMKICEIKHCQISDSMIFNNKHNYTQVHFPWNCVLLHSVNPLQFQNRIASTDYMHLSNVWAFLKHCWMQFPDILQFKKSLSTEISLKCETGSNLSILDSGEPSQTLQCTSGSTQHKT